METNLYVIFVRASHIDPEPRLMKAAKWIKDCDDQWKIKAIGWDRTGKSKKKEIIEGIEINRFYAKGEYGKGFSKNIVGLILFNLYLLFTFLTTKVDVIHACDLDTALPAFLASRLKRTKFVYDIYDFYSDNRKLGKLDFIVRNLELWIIKKADIAIIADERRIKQLGDIGNDVKNKIVVIYNTPEDMLAKNSKQEIKYLVGYVGVLIPNRRLLETAEIIKKEKHFNICFAGYGSLEKQLLTISNQCDRISFLGKVTYDKALIIEQQATVILAMYDPKVRNNRYAAPNKLCEAMMLGKPIITSSGTLCADIVQEEGIGFVVPYDDDRAMKDILVYIQENMDIVKDMGKRARILYDSKYSAISMKKCLQNAYCQLIRTKVD